MLAESFILAVKMSTLVISMALIAYMARAKKGGKEEGKTDNFSKEMVKVKYLLDEKNYAGARAYCEAAIVTEGSRHGTSSIYGEDVSRMASSMGGIYENMRKKETGIPEGADPRRYIEETIHHYRHFELFKKFGKEKTANIMERFYEIQPKNEGEAVEFLNKELSKSEKKEINPLKKVAGDIFGFATGKWYQKKKEKI